MANPQKENGYTAIANEIMDAFARTYLPSGERQVLDVILRKTYGFNKKMDGISFSQFQEATGLSRRTVIYALENLEAKRMIVVSKSRNALLNNPNSYKFNKDYESWVVQNSAPSVEMNRKYAKEGSAKRRKGGGGSAKLGKKVVQNYDEKVKSFAPTKDKSKYTKDIASRGDAAIPRIIDLFKEVNPTHDRLFAQPPQRAAVERLLVKFDEEKLASIVRFLPKSNAARYAPTITTPVQLERDLGRLIAWGQKEKNTKKTNVAFV